MPTNQSSQGLNHYPKPTLDRPMAPAAYVAADGLVGHQWEEKPLVLPMLPPPPQCRGMLGQGGRKQGVVGEGVTLLEKKGRGMR